jgi:hypothetical protein
MPTLIAIFLSCSGFVLFRFATAPRTEPSYNQAVDTMRIAARLEVEKSIAAVLPSQPANQRAMNIADAIDRLSSSCKWLSPDEFAHAMNWTVGAILDNPCER